MSIAFGDATIATNTTAATGLAIANQTADFK
jgi:hypothetical protein